MTNHRCPLCATTFEAETDMRIHLEVEHRKSELAKQIVETAPPPRDPIADHEHDTSRDELTTHPA